MITSTQVLCDVSRALGLAEALASPLSPETRPGSTEEVAGEIVELLVRTRDWLLENHITKGAP